MRIICALLIAATLVSPGCTRNSLIRHTVGGATTPMDIQYQMVLNNIARFSLNPETLPAQARIQDGTVQVGDDFGSLMFERGGFELGPVARRDIAMQWDTNAVLEPVEVQDLRNLYRRALGLPPMPDPHFVNKIRLDQFENALENGEADNGNGNNGNGNGGKTAEKRNSYDDVAAGELSSKKPQRLGVGSNEPSPPRPGIEFDVPVGWFCIGGKRDVPKGACYVGHWCDRYVWVMPEGVGGLSEFTLAVLAVTKLEPGELRMRRGLAVTRRRAR